MNAYLLTTLSIVLKCVLSDTTATTTSTAIPVNITIANTSPQTVTDGCAQVCSKTYALHTYPQSEHLNACNRGCRFATLIDLVSIDRSDGNSTRDECVHACGESYNDSSYYACTIGCNNITPLMNKNSVSDDDSAQSDQILISPFHMMRSLFQNLMNRGAQIVHQSSMSIYISRNSDGDSKVVVIQSSEPEVVVHQYPDLSQSEPVTGAEERTTSDYKPRIDVSLFTNENPLLVNHPKKQDNSWANCFGYQSVGVPRWILASVLFLAIFVLAWICCATTATAPDHRVRPRIGMGSDLKYLCLYDEPIKLVINDKPPNYQDVHDGSLPLKVNIDN